MKIFVVLGTQPYKFNRLLNDLYYIYVRNEYNLSKYDIIVQSGCTNINFNHDRIKIFSYLDNNEMKTIIKNSDLIITHGGAGSIFEALNFNKKIIAIPRRKKFNEHIDDHQLELTTALYLKRYIISCNTLKEGFDMLKTFNFKRYQTDNNCYIDYIKKII